MIFATDTPSNCRKSLVTATRALQWSHATHTAPPKSQSTQHRVITPLILFQHKRKTADFVGNQPFSVERTTGIEP